MTIAVAIFAHNEEKRIKAALASLPLHRADCIFHVLVNGSTDSTADIAREFANKHVTVIAHILETGGKARTWNHYIHAVITGAESHYIFMDGDAELTPSAIAALITTLDAFPNANAASGMPMNGRKFAQYQRRLRRDRGIFGDLYALSSNFVRRIKTAGLCLPADLIGDDGLIGAWARCDLRTEKHEDKMRIIPCEAAGFYCEPFSKNIAKSWRMQYKRMVNYSVRHFQNRIISAVMRRDGPTGLPVRMADLYPTWLGQFRARSQPSLWWFDKKALRRMRRSVHS
jgi:glycosyltransferase involved in cell wall biosynthesis